MLSKRTFEGDGGACKTRSWLGASFAWPARPLGVCSPSYAWPATKKECTPLGVAGTCPQSLFGILGVDRLPDGVPEHSARSGRPFRSPEARRKVTTVPIFAAGTCLILVTVIELTVNALETRTKRKSKR